MKVMNMKISRSAKTDSGIKRKLMCIVYLETLNGIELTFKYEQKRNQNSSQIIYIYDMIYRLLSRWHS